MTGCECCTPAVCRCPVPVPVPVFLGLAVQCGECLRAIAAGLDPDPATTVATARAVLR